MTTLPKSTTAVQLETPWTPDELQLLQRINGILHELLDAAIEDDVQLSGRHVIDVLLARLSAAEHHVASRLGLSLLLATATQTQLVNLGVRRSQTVQ
jgi:hypothetical protein